MPARPQEMEERGRVVAGARLWCGVAYHHRAAVRPGPGGRGAIDCARILIETFADAGLISRFVPEEYSPDWHLHRGEERYLSVIESYCRQVGEGQASLVERGPDFTVEPGDVLMWRHGRTFSHSAIVTSWPLIVHAFAPEESVVECNVNGTPMAEKPMRVYSYWQR
jgi:hypothetical protein